MTIAMMRSPVYVKLTRPEGYEDVCEQLVIEDAEIHPAFMAEPATEEVERLRSEVRAMTELLIDLHASGVLSEGQVAKATGLDLVQIRALTEARDGEGEWKWLTNRP